MCTYTRRRHKCPAQVRRVLSTRLPHAATNYTAVSLVPSTAPATCTALVAAANEAAMRCVAPRIIRAGAGAASK